MINRNFAALYTVAALLVFLSGSAAAQESKGGSYTKIPMVKGIELSKPGTPAPDFTVKDLAGADFHLKDHSGKNAVLLFFWSFFCGPCREEIPMINEMTRAYGDRGLAVVGVNLDGVEMKKAVDKFVVSEKIGFRIVFDELEGDAFRVADPYGVAGTPALFVIDRKGSITYSTMGAVTGPQLRGEIEKAIK